MSMCKVWGAGNHSRGTKELSAAGVVFENERGSRSGNEAQRGDVSCARVHSN